MCPLGRCHTCFAGSGLSRSGGVYEGAHPEAWRWREPPRHAGEAERIYDAEGKRVHGLAVCHATARSRHQQDLEALPTK
eukprot:CAMPEP_0176247996 /NCGR_PEP_ID=MMETSP0121_2-20121125/33241_1 /TAXON_ID=160619 /ORGANISM="Kryptoperidinium foliaceum, Strain CCMP 1326" /LENGTH=78 /DNA_ID=CAMNT_0017587665 /DNA_START=106 /DNA_END=342 /DNA_ORIENTATION=-